MTVNICKVLEMVESSHRTLSENLAILRGQAMAMQRNRVNKSRPLQLQGQRSRGSQRYSAQKYKILSKDKSIKFALSKIRIEHYSSTNSSTRDEVEVPRRSLRVDRRRREHDDNREDGQLGGCNGEGNGDATARPSKPHLHLRYYTSCGHQVSYAVRASESEDSYGMCVCAKPPRYDTFRFRNGGMTAGMEGGPQQQQGQQQQPAQQTNTVLQPWNENANNITNNNGSGSIAGGYGGMGVATREMRYRQNREEYDGFCESCATASS